MARPWLDWIGSAAAIAGALLVALNAGAHVVVIGYALFLASSVIWSWLALRRYDDALLAMQAVFVCLNVLGLIRWAAP